MERDLTRNEWTHTLESDGGELQGAALAHLEDIGLEVGHRLTRTHRIVETDPLAARAEMRQRTLLRREAWAVRIESALCLESSVSEFRFSGHLEAYEDERCVFSRTWDEAIPRRLL